MSSPNKTPTHLIDSYIRSEPAHVQRILRALRVLIRKAAPGATEKIAWGMPTFYLQGNLIHFAAFKNHYSLFPGSDAVKHFKKELTVRGLVCSKGTIPIPYETPLPAQWVTRIVKYCIKRNLAEAARKVKAKGATNKKTFVAKPQGETHQGTRLQRPTRARHPMPTFVRSALLKAKLMEAYRARPPYQQNDYIGWISRAVREETQQKRLAQMLQELKSGDKYMNMKYAGSRAKKS